MMSVMQDFAAGAANVASPEALIAFGVAAVIGSGAVAAVDATRSAFKVGRFNAVSFIRGAFVGVGVYGLAIGAYAIQAMGFGVPSGLIEIVADSSLAKGAGITAATLGAGGVALAATRLKALKP